MSPYFRYIQQLYFENPKDQVLDIQCLGRDAESKPLSVLFTYKIESNFLMLVQYSLKQPSRRELRLSYQFIQIAPEYTISEAQIHLNSLFIRQTGKLKEEVAMLIHNQETGDAVVRVIDVKQLIDDFNNEEVCPLEIQTCSVKFG